VNCETQQEVDELWGKLSASKADEQCGWLKDKLRPVVADHPEHLGQVDGDKNPKKAGAAVQAMLQMKKIDIKGLQKRFDAA